MDESLAAQQPPAAWPGRRVAWLLLALGYLGVAVIRWRLRDMPLERDEGEYAYFGQLLLRGMPPFQNAYTMKLPGTQMAYAAAMALFGETAAGIRIGLLLANAATAALLFVLGKRLLGTVGALAAAMAFSWLSASSAMLALFGHATHFVLLPAVAGLLLLLRAADSGRLPIFFGSGLLLGLALLMKQPGGVFLAFSAAWLAWKRLAQPGEGRGKRLLAEEGALVAGATAPLAAILAWVWFGGTFEVFWFWVVRYAREYSGILGWSAGVPALARAAGAALGEAGLLWTLAGVGLVLAAWPRWALPGRAFLLGLPAFSFVGVSAGLYYRPHYFILALPAVALLAGAAARFAQERSRAGAASWVPGAAALALVAVGCGEAAWSQRDLLFRMTPDQVSRRLYGGNPFPESRLIARYLAERTGPSDRIAILGSEPQILFYSGRLSATGYAYVYGLMEPQPFARAMQVQLAREVEGARPAFVVWTQVPTSWAAWPTSSAWILEWATRHLAREYQLVGQVHIVSPDRTDYYWDAAAPLAPAPPLNRVLVFRRRDFEPRGGG